MYGPSRVRAVMRFAVLRAVPRRYRKWLVSTLRQKKRY